MSNEIITTRNLPRGARVKIDCVIDGVERKDEVVTFRKMDGMYGQRFTHDGHMVIFNSKNGFKKADNGFYDLIV